MELRIKQKQKTRQNKTKQKTCCVVVSGEEVRNDPSVSGGRDDIGMPDLDTGGSDGRTVCVP